MENDEDEEVNEDHKSLDSYKYEIPSVLKAAWGNSLDFIFCAAGYVIGFGNFWRYPYLYYRNGGGAFFIIYLICLLAVGLPFMLLELSLGQFTGGTIGYWMICPLFQGIEYISSWINLFIVYSYILLMSWSVVYISYLFTKDIPWTKCRKPWATSLCQDYLKPISLENCTGNLLPFSNGTCYDMATGSIYGIYDQNIAKTHNIHKVIPAEDFMNYESLKIKIGDGVNNLVFLDVRLAICLGVTWICLFLGQLKGVKTTGKIAYFTVTFPMVVMVIMLINSLTMQGSSNGLKFYFYIDITRAGDKLVWEDAIMQAIFTLSVCTNCLPFLASHNRFHRNVVRDAFLLVFLDTMSSFVAGIALFSYAGVFAYQMNSSVSDIVTADDFLAFALYPQALTLLPLSRIWSVVFFSMLFTLGIDTELVTIETLIRDLSKLFKFRVRHRLAVSGVVCTTLYILGLPMATPSGYDVYSFISGINSSLTCGIVLLFGALSVCIYGPKRFCRRIQSMSGETPIAQIPWKYMQWYFIVCWTFFVPITASILIIWTIYKRCTEEASNQPTWAKVLGSIIEMVVILSGVLFGAWTTYKARGNTFKEKFSNMLIPHPIYENESIETGPSEKELKQKEITQGFSFSSYSREHSEAHDSGSLKHVESSATFLMRSSSSFSKPEKKVYRKKKSHRKRMEKKEVKFHLPTDSTDSAMPPPHLLDLFELSNRSTTGEISDAGSEKSAPSPRRISQLSSSRLRSGKRRKRRRHSSLVSDPYEFQRQRRNIARESTSEFVSDFSNKERRMRQNSI